MRTLATRWTGALALAAPAAALAHESERVIRQAPALGMTGLWLLANAAYAGMRAQDSQSHNARAIAFLFGLPLSLLTLIVVEEGSERAYGVDLPKRRPAPTANAPDNLGDAP